ncbi:DUF2851 family protein, partial [Chloroflexota bacterium]
AGFLISAGDERFLAKVERFRADLIQMEASQCLYQGIMGALGYSKNKMPFLELAHRLPLRTLESVTQSKMPDEKYLARQQALLLGTAGLLPPQCHQEYQANKSGNKRLDRLGNLWDYSRRAKAMSPDAWHLFRVRPNNSPTRRLLAMSYLLLRYRDKGILEALTSMIQDIPTGRGYLELEEKLMVTTNGYQVSPFDFRSGNMAGKQTLLGRRRAADIIVNVLLPFTLAWSQLITHPKLGEKSISLYHGYPRLVANSIEKHMKRQLGLGSTLINSAQRQQGLIHIYNTLCTQGRCNECFLS